MFMQTDQYRVSTHVILPFEFKHWVKLLCYPYSECSSQYYDVHSILRHEVSALDPDVPLITLLIFIL